MSAEMVEVPCTIVHESELGYKVDHGGARNVWLPKSQCEWDLIERVMRMPEWLAIKKGLV